jgi:hypothetical protein
LKAETPCCPSRKFLEYGRNKMAIWRDIDPNTPISIYGLIDPRTKLVRYVGWTYRTLEIRLIEHISDAKGNKPKSKNHRCNWIRSLLRENLDPEIILLEESTYSKMEEKESFWIKYYGRENLVNGTDGGEGNLGWCPTAEQRQKASEKLKGKPAWNKGIPMREESKIKLSKANSGKPGSWIGRHHTDESKKKLSESKLGKPSPMKGVHYWTDELKNKLSISKKEKMTDEKRKHISDGLKGREGENKFEKLDIESSSQYIGVYWHEQSQRWRSRIVVDGERIHVCQFENEYYAALGFDFALIFYYGEKYEPNFPQYKDFYFDYLSQFIINGDKGLRKIIKQYIQTLENKNN